MASCQEDNVPPESPVIEEKPQESEITVESKEVPCVKNSAPTPLAKAIADDERKAAAKYGNMKKKQTDVMRKRMMGGGKQYFDSGDYNVGKQCTPAVHPAISPEQPAIERLRNRNLSIPNTHLTRLS